MDRNQFLKNLRASKVKLRSVQVPGWDGLVYLRPQTLGEIRDALMKATPEDATADARSQMNRDPLYLARSIARLVRDEAGELLFDPDNDGQMGELMADLADTGPAISKLLNEVYNELNEPSRVEVTPEGN